MEPNFIKVNMIMQTMDGDRLVEEVENIGYIRPLDIRFIYPSTSHRNKCFVVNYSGQRMEILEPVESILRKMGETTLIRSKLVK